MGEVIKLAIGAVVGFLMQSGSIDNRFGGADRAAAGTRIHKQLQKEAGPEYQPEVALSMQISHMGEEYLLGGRADGVFTHNGLLTVDEIKTTAVPMEMIDDCFNGAHWGQAYCYAHILAVERGLSHVGIRLTYYNIDTDEVKRFERTKPASELDNFVQDLLGQYRKWAVFQRTWKEIRGESIQKTAFPFEQYRAGQRQLAVAVYRTIEQEGRLFAEAPTGIGKTVSTLFPTIKAMGEGMVERIFYLTAKTITRQVAEEAFALMGKGGLRVKTVTLTAKDKICFLEERNCNPEACTYANGYYDRARDGIYDMLCAGDSFSREDVERAARRLGVCPFELSLDLSSWCDAIICDYNYLFDPVAALQRFFSDNRPSDYVFLIDEAHNLVDRAREMYSAEITRSEIVALKKLVGKGGGALGRTLRALDTCLREIGKGCGEKGFTISEQPEDRLCDAVNKFRAAASAWLEANKEPSTMRAMVLERFFEASFFQRILEIYDDHYCAFSTHTYMETAVKLLCMDPSELLDERLSKGRSTVFFSATLSPQDYYRDVLGGGDDAKRLRLGSPFPRDNLCLLCADGISTKYLDRESSLAPIAGLLFSLINGKRGNYVAYFPSYRYLRDVCRVFHNCYPWVDTIVQTSDMNERCRESFLARFDSENQASLLAFCVLGGVFAEGIDLKGDRLIGTAIIGVGLPQIGPELDHMQRYFNARRGAGYEYIYRYPGMNKVLQAAGRVIRGESDKGAVLLIDSRFTGGAYQAIFPAHWSNWRRVADEKEVAQGLAEFWEGQ